MAKNTRPRSEAFREMLANEYLNSTISIKELSDKYHTDAAYQLEKHGVSLKGRGVQRMLSRTGCICYDWNASEIKTEEQAYTLGFLMADGHNTGSQVGIKVKTSDGYILEKMKNCFSKEIKLQEHEDYCSFVISATTVCDNLRNLGIVEHKSHSEKHIPEMPSDLVRHFIRGYFDGDGTVFICKSGKNRFFKCNICSSTRNILEMFKDVLAKDGIISTINLEKRVGKPYKVCGKCDGIASMDMYRLFIRQKASIEKLFHYLYDGATIFLKRKHDVFSDNKELFVYIRHANTELTEQIAKGCSAV